jgi:hypothetical protein
MGCMGCSQLEPKVIITIVISLAFLLWDWFKDWSMVYKFYRSARTDL